MTDIINTLPTEEGNRRWPDYPVGFNANESDDPAEWSTCQCKTTCQNPCKGGCGCEACGHAYSDFLSAE